MVIILHRFQHVSTSFYILDAIKKVILNGRQGSQPKKFEDVEVEALFDQESTAKRTCNIIKC